MEELSKSKNEFLVITNPLCTLQAQIILFRIKAKNLFPEYVIRVGIQGVILSGKRPLED